MSNYRKSYSLAKVKNRLRAEALKTEDEEVAKLFWSLYYDARNAEYEVDAVVQHTQILRLVEIMVQHGLLQRAIDEAQALADSNPAQEDDNASDTETSTYLKRELPQQKRLF